MLDIFAHCLLVVPSHPLYNFIVVMIVRACRANVISAIMKLVAQTGQCPAKVLEFVRLFTQSKSLDVQQRCVCVCVLASHRCMQNVCLSLLSVVAPADASSLLLYSIAQPPWPMPCPWTRRARTLRFSPPSPPPPPTWRSWSHILRDLH